MQRARVYYPLDNVYRYLANNLLNLYDWYNLNLFPISVAERDSRQETLRKVYNE